MESGEVRAAASYSAHPDVGFAAGEVIGDLLERVDPHPDLAVLAASGRHARQLPKIVATVQALLAPEVLIGTTAEVVFGGEATSSTTTTGGRRVDDGCLAIWTATGWQLRKLRLTVAGDGRLVGAPAEMEPGSVAVLFTDRQFPVERLTELRAVGGEPIGWLGGREAITEDGPDFRLVDGAELHRDGAIGVLLPGELAQGFELDPRRWDDEEAMLAGSVSMGDGRAAIVFAGRRADLVGSDSPDLEELFERYARALIGIRCRPFFSWPFVPGPPDQRSGFDRRMAVLSYGTR